MIKKNILAFTFVEIIVSITILVILSTLWFYSYSQHLSDARDTERKSDFANIMSSLKLHKQKRATYPSPWSSTDIVYSWGIVAIQWRFDDSVVISTLDKLPKDPYIKVPYIYSVTGNKQEFQLSATLENNNSYTALLEWDYKTVARNIMPTLSIAVEWLTNIEIKDWYLDWTTNRDKFVLNKWIHNIPYSFVSPYAPYSDWSNFLWIMSDPDKEFWQNSDYRSCQEIIDDWKFFWSWEYQILSSTWTLININC